jgi:6-phosphogluconolactonase
MAKLEIAAVHVVDTEAVPRVGATFIADRLRAGIAARGNVSLALAGGTTPRRIYEELAALPIDWSRVHVYFGDERFVPAGDPDSNFRMAREALFDRVSGLHVHRMEGERTDREQAADDYAAQLPEALDVVVLGLGEDGHTASLFPGTDWSRPTGRKTIVVTNSPKPPPLRMSVTPDVLWAARARLIVATGKGKAEPVRRALEGDVNPALLPVQTVRDATWLVDRAAASLLSRRPEHLRSATG